MKTIKVNPVLFFAALMFSPVAGLFIGISESLLTLRVLGLDASIKMRWVIVLPVALIAAVALTLKFSWIFYSACFFLVLITSTWSKEAFLNWIADQIENFVKGTNIVLVLFHEIITTLRDVVTKFNNFISQVPLSPPRASLA